MNQTSGISSDGEHLPCHRHVRPIFEMKWRPRAFSRVSTGDSDILSSCDMNDEHA